jgi:hypothetical protein
MEASQSVFTVKVVCDDTCSYVSLLGYLHLWSGVKGKSNDEGWPEGKRVTTVHFETSSDKEMFCKMFRVDGCKLVTS